MIGCVGSGDLRLGNVITRSESNGQWGFPTCLAEVPPRSGSSSMRAKRRRVERPDPTLAACGEDGRGRLRDVATRHELMRRDCVKGDDWTSQQRQVLGGRHHSLVCCFASEGKAATIIWRTAETMRNASIFSSAHPSNAALTPSVPCRLWTRRRAHPKTETTTMPEAISGKVAGSGTRLWHRQDLTNAVQTKRVSRTHYGPLDLFVVTEFGVS